MVGWYPTDEVVVVAKRNRSVEAEQPLALKVLAAKDGRECRHLVCVLTALAGQNYGSALLPALGQLVKETVALQSVEELLAIDGSCNMP